MAQTWNPERYARNARYVADLAAPVVELLAPRRGERILDLGCGDGAARGFRVDSMTLGPRSTPLPEDLGAWLETFFEGYIAALPPSERTAFVREVVAALHPALHGPDGGWTADYVLLRFAARKPAPEEDRSWDSRCAGA